MEKNVIITISALAIISTITLVSVQNAEASNFLLSVPSTLIAFWPADGNTHDVTGHGHTGTISGGVTFGHGITRGAFVFNGINGTVKVGGLGINNTNTPFSIVAWVKPSKPSIAKGLAGEIVQEGSSPSGTIFNDQFMVGLLTSPTGHPNTVSLEIGATQTYSQLIYTNSTLTGGQWTQVVATYDGSRTAGGMSIYLNGTKQSVTLLGSGFTGSEIPRDQWSIGAQGYAPHITNPFQGGIDDIRVYSCPLSSSDVKALFEGFNVVKCS